MIATASAAVLLCYVLSSCEVSWKQYWDLYDEPKWSSKQLCEIHVVAIQGNAPSCYQIVFLYGDQCKLPNKRKQMHIEVIPIDKLSFSSLGAIGLYMWTTCDSAVL